MDDKRRMWCVVTGDGVKSYFPRTKWYDAVIRSARKGIVRDKYGTIDYVRLVWGYALGQVVVAYKPPVGEEWRWGETEIASYDTEEERLEQWVRQYEEKTTPEE